MTGKLTDMSVEDQLEERHQARLSLAEYARIHAERNERIVRAAQAGISVAEVARLVGLNRTYVHEIVKAAGETE
jgi:hypothetical protein